jgi:hypothetical protein
VYPVLSSRTRAPVVGTTKCPESLCLTSALPPSGRRGPSPPRTLLLVHRFYRLIRQSSSGSPLLRLFTSFEESLQVATSPCCQRDFPDVILRIFPEMLEPIPRRSAECACLVLPQPSSAFPIIRLGRHSRGLPRTRLSTGRLTRLQLFRYVHASQFARLPDRSYRCKFPRRAAEAFISEQNVRRYLRTHRTCYPADYRQLPERGLSPRKIRSLVSCSRMMPTFPGSSLKVALQCWSARTGVSAPP